MQQITKGRMNCPGHSSTAGGRGARGQNSRFCTEQRLGCLVSETGKSKAFITLSQIKINVFFL